MKHFIIQGAMDKWIAMYHQPIMNAHIHDKNYEWFDAAKMWSTLIPFKQDIILLYLWVGQ